jgi:hypothetical protein
MQQNARSFFFIPVEAEEKSKPADINIEALQEFLGI